jgi:hypothetical protein
MVSIDWGSPSLRRNRLIVTSTTLVISHPCGVACCGGRGHIDGSGLWKWAPERQVRRDR